MNEERLFSLRNRWFVVTVGGTLALAAFSVVVGFVWLPSAQTDQPFQGVWNAICSAAGVPQQWLRGGSAAPAPLVQTSAVVMTPQLLDESSELSIGRGATLALRCSMCHGVGGAVQTYFPNLAGQYASVIYKQLRDFHSGARQNAVMSPMAVNLRESDMRDLAAYYSHLPRPVAQGIAVSAPTPAIVVHGSPLRNISTCAACHGGVAHKAGSPWLDGQPAAYLRAQLQAFASESRHNDINEQMRNVARNMTPAEIDEAAAFYANAPSK